MRILDDKNFLQLEKIEIHGYKKINHVTMQSKLNSLIGQNLLLINPKDIEKIIEIFQLNQRQKIQAQKLINVF